MSSWVKIPCHFGDQILRPRDFPRHHASRQLYDHHMHLSPISRGSQTHPSNLGSWRVPESHQNGYKFSFFSLFYVQGMFVGEKIGSPCNLIGGTKHIEIWPHPGTGIASLPAEPTTISKTLLNLWTSDPIIHHKELKISQENPFFVTLTQRIQMTGQIKVHKIKKRNSSTIPQATPRKSWLWYKQRFPFDPLNFLLQFQNMTPPPPHLSCFRSMNL